MTTPEENNVDIEEQPETLISPDHPDVPEGLKPYIRQYIEALNARDAEIDFLKSQQGLPHPDGLWLFTQLDNGVETEKILTIDEWEKFQGRLKQLFKPYELISFSYFPQAFEELVNAGRNKEERLLQKVKHFKDDILTWMRAIAIYCDSVANASTHKEKDARLRGVISVIESAIQRIRDEQDNLLTNYYSEFPDVFRSDYPVRRYVERVRELEAEIKQLKTGESPSPFGGNSDEF